MPTLELTLPNLHTAQDTVHDCNSRFIVLVTGRRWGKTMYGVYRCIEIAAQGGRVWWVAPTYPMSRVGWRIIMQMGLQIPGCQIHKTDRIITLPGGGTVQVRSGDKPEALRGEGLHLAVLDECAYMQESVWVESIRPTLSDEKGKALFISTPRGGNWFAHLYKYAVKRNDDQWAGFQYVSATNPFLDVDEIESARDTQSDRLFRQEYLAEILDDVPGALWTRTLLDTTRFPDGIDCPPMKRIVVGVDPAVTSKTTSDETGIVVCGIDGDDNGYVLGDCTMRGTPTQWAGAVIAAYHRWGADRVVAEVNQGGDMVENTLRQVDPSVSYRAVHAAKSKYRRAEPIAAQYEKGRVHHVGMFPELEDQMCSWVQGEDSPDRLDALVWAFNDLLLGRQGRLIL